MPDLFYKQKVVFLLSKHFGGGAETSIQQLNNSLKKQFMNSEIWGINSEESNNPEYQFSFGRDKSGGMLHNLRIVLDFRKKCKAENVGVMVLNCDLPELYGALTPRKTKIIVVEQSTHPWMGRRLLGRVVRLVLVLKGAAWVKIFNEQKIWSVYGQRVYLGPNLIDTRMPGPISSGPIHGLQRIVFLGRFHVQKRPQWIIQLGADSGIPVLMIGDGELRQELHDLAETLNVNVEFTGFLSNPWKSIRKGDVLILTSIFEGKPLVIEEALVRGVPVLAMNLYGLAKEYEECPVYFADTYIQLLDLVKNFSIHVNQTSINPDFPNRIRENNELKLPRWIEILKKEIED